MRKDLMNKKPSYIEDRRNSSPAAYSFGDRNIDKAITQIQSTAPGPQMKPRQAMGVSPEEALAITARHPEDEMAQDE